METLHNITTPNNPNLTARIRSVLTVAGIVTAIICSLVLLKDADDTERVEALAPRPIKMLNVADTDLPGIIKNIAVTSTMWLFR